jgi:hypothetical protein
LLPSFRPPKHYPISPGSHYCWIRSGAPSTRHHMHHHFCYRTSGKVWSISPPSPLMMPSCPDIVTSSSTDALLQTLPALRTESSRHWMSPLLHTLHNICICPCSMFYVCTCTFVYTFPPPFDKAEPLMAFAEQLNWHREWRMQVQWFFRVNLLSLDAKP